MTYKTTFALYESFLHFYHLDHSNAAVHMAPVRYSPITFRLAEALASNELGIYVALVHEGWSERELQLVMKDLGKYEEDKGR